MLFPTVFRNDFFDDFNDFMDFPTRNDFRHDLMKSDVKDEGDHFELEMDLPGFKKEDVKIQLKDGVLNITASSKVSNDEKDENGKYIRRERFQGTCTRSFYVGEDVKDSDIKAKFANGVLTVNVPKNAEKPEIEENKYIAIED
ncbi:MAG: Hsp20/alpha crystallin family protein [Eubacterium sp.]|jgi:HSP20 family protein